MLAYHLDSGGGLSTQTKKRWSRSRSSDFHREHVPHSVACRTYLFASCNPLQLHACAYILFPVSESPG
jgi:hypothetical protein